MIKKLCFFTINFSFDRQILIDYLEDIFPREVELFLFVPRECRGKYVSKKIKIVESDKNKYFVFSELRNFCRKNKIDRIVNLGVLPQESFVMAFASLFTKTDFICHLVGNLFDSFKVRLNLMAVKSFLQLVFTYPMILFTKRYYVGGKDIYLASKRYFFFSRKKIEYLGMPIDTTNLFVLKNKEKIRKKLKLPLNKKIAITVGRIEYEKGTDIILELAKRNKDILFILIGKLGYPKVASNDLKNVLILPSQKQEILADYYSAADLGIFPTRIDAGPAVARECMASGTPIIISNIRGPRIIEHAIKARVDAEDFNEKIEYYFNLPEKQKKILIAKGREFVVRENSREVLRQQYIDKFVKF